MSGDNIPFRLSMGFLYSGEMGAKLNKFFQFCTMKVIEILKLGREILKTMSESGIKLDDYKYADMLQEYEKMRSDGEKYWYVIKCLSDRYNVSESKAIRIIRRLSKEVKN